VYFRVETILEEEPGEALMVTWKWNRLASCASHHRQSGAEGFLDPDEPVKGILGPITGPSGPSRLFPLQRCNDAERRQARAAGIYVLTARITITADSRIT